MFEAELHCRDTDLLTLHHSDGIFIIQQSTSNITWSKPRVVQGIMSIFSGLEPGQFYRYRVKRVINNSVSKPELTVWFQTIKSENLDVINTDITVLIYHFVMFLLIEF